MNQVHSTTTEGKKAKHLSFEERVIIQTRLKDKWSPNKIAAGLGRTPNAIRNEIKRGTVMLYNGRVSRYTATAGQKAYAQNRQNCCHHYELLEIPEFVPFVEEKVLGENHWSLDACVGYLSMICFRTRRLLRWRSSMIRLAARASAATSSVNWRSLPGMRQNQLMVIMATS